MKTKNISRRGFIKLGAAAATTMVVSNDALSRSGSFLTWGGMDFSPTRGCPRKAVPTACWQCVTRCPAIGYVEDGRVVKMEGQPSSIRTLGKMCAKGQAGVNQINDPDRILYPLKRVGARGSGRWQRISWEEALADLTLRLKTLRIEGHPEKFMFHYGRMKGSSEKLIKTFLANYGTGTICNHASISQSGKWVAQELTWGKQYDNWDFDNTSYILNFGSNVLEAHSNHVPLAQRLVTAVVERRVKLVTFDVRLANTVAKSTQWVPIRPGTDGAVALAMCNVIMQGDLYRGAGEEFLKYCKVTTNHDASIKEKVAALKKYLAEYTPEWAEKISGVPAGTIWTTAVEFAKAKPAVVISYRGASAHYNGHATERAIQMLAAITGNIDIPGGRCRAIRPDWHYPTGPANKPKAKKLEITDGFKGQVLFPHHHVNHQVFKMIKDGSAGRPDIYMWYCHNPVYSNGEVQENIDVLKDEKLIPYTVCISPFYDESASLADLILPDVTYLERWDWEDQIGPNQIPEYYIRQPVVEPLGEARDFKDVCCDLAERMGFPLGFSSAEDFVRKSCEMTPGVKEAGGFYYMKEHGVWYDVNAKPLYHDYKELVPGHKLKHDGVIYDKATGVYWNWKVCRYTREEALLLGYANVECSYRGYVGQKIGDKVYVGFPPDAVNKSGYFEIYSDLMEAKGYPPLPTYIPIPSHMRIKKGQLILTTYKVNVQSHSRTQNCKWLTEIYHENPAWINPVSAEEHGIKNDDTIRVTSGIGEIIVIARVTPAVVPGVIAISNHCGHWQYGRYASSQRAPTGTTVHGHGSHKWWNYNGVHPNWLIPNIPDPVTGQQACMDTVVSVESV